MQRKTFLLSSSIVFETFQNWGLLLKEKGGKFFSFKSSLQQEGREYFHIEVISFGGISIPL